MPPHSLALVPAPWPEWSGSLYWRQARTNDTVQARYSPHDRLESIKPAENPIACALPVWQCACATRYSLTAFQSRTHVRHLAFSIIQFEYLENEKINDNNPHWTHSQWRCSASLNSVSRQYVEPFQLQNAFAVIWNMHARAQDPCKLRSWLWGSEYKNSQSSIKTCTQCLILNDNSHSTRMKQLAT